MDGRDITPYLMGSQNAEKSVKPFEFLYSYSNNMPSGLRMGPWKLMTRLGSQLGKNYGFKASVEKPLLFQIEEDLYETYDQAKEHPERVNKMKAVYKDKTAQLISEGNFWNLPYPKTKTTPKTKKSKH